jgi:hypothetical protein
MRNREGWQRGDWRAEDDWRQERQARQERQGPQDRPDRAERDDRDRRELGGWRPETRYARGEGYGGGGEGYRGGYDDLSWRDDEREREWTGYGYGRDEGYRSAGGGYGNPGHGRGRGWSSGGGSGMGDDYGSQGYNLGTNYGQGGPQGQGFGQGSSSYGRQGYGGGGAYGQGPREAGYGGFGNPGYRRGEGSWRQGRWSEGEMRGANEPYDPFYQPPARAQARWDRPERWDEERRTGAAGSQPGSQPGSYDRQAMRVRPPRGYVRSDERIREDICDAIVMEAIDAGDVDVTVTTGEVTLSGNVDDKQDKRRLEDIAEQVPGVRTVNNQLRVGGQAQGQGTGTASQSGQLGTTSQNAVTGGAKNAAGPNATRTS